MKYEVCVCVNAVMLLIKWTWQPPWTGSCPACTHPANPLPNPCLRNPCNLQPVSCNRRMGPRKMQSVGDRSKAFPNAIRRSFGFVRASLANRARAQINLALPDSPFFSRAKNNHTTRCPSGNQNQLLSLEKVIPHRGKLCCTFKWTG